MREIPEMVESEKLSKIKAKIKALSNKTIDRGATEAEMQSAMRVIGKLLAEFNLTMDEVDLSTEDFITEVIQTRDIKGSAIHGVVGAIAKFCDCKVWFIRNREKRLTYHYFGLESDVLMAKYLTDMINTTIRTETQNFKKTSIYKTAVNKRSANVSFYRAMAKRIHQRLLELKQENDVTGDGKSLIVLKNQVLNQKYEAKKEEFNIRPRHINYNSRDALASYAGKRAANNVNLQRPLTSDAKPEVYKLT